MGIKVAHFNPIGVVHLFPIKSDESIILEKRIKGKSFYW